MILPNFLFKLGLAARDIKVGSKENEEEKEEEGINDLFFLVLVLFSFLPIPGDCIVKYVRRGKSLFKLLFFCFVLIEKKKERKI